MSAQTEQQAVGIARRLSQRELDLLRALFDYELLSTSQIKVLYFTSIRRCQDVLKHLWDLELIDKDKPYQPIGVGRAESLWTLTEQGVRIVAVVMGKARSQIGWMPRHSFHASDHQLDHLLGVNHFFISLVEASLGYPGQGLQKWVTSRQVQSQNNWVTHDGFGRYQHEQGACDFYFEYDRATEWHDQLVGKLRGYLLMAIKWTEEGAEHFPNVVVMVPTNKRENAFDRAMKASVESIQIEEKTAVSLPFFITSVELVSELGVLGKVWRSFVPPPADRPLAPMLLAERLSLIELPSRKAGPFDIERCLGKKPISNLRRHIQPPFPSGNPGTGETVA